MYAVIGVSANIGILLLFKYNQLLFAQLNLEFAGKNLGNYLLTLPLPIGISFFTFQGISLVIDVYRSRKNPRGENILRFESFRTNLFQTAFFISFFAQLIAGPIVKANHFMPQIMQKQLSRVKWRNILKTAILGYFFKMVIADNLKDYTFWIAYPYFENFSSLSLIVILGAFSMQIFADFAGYSCIAIALGSLFGYELPINFNYPYLARSFSEFWQRWHISLSAWLRDYLYIPLGGNRKGHVRTYINIFIVMILGGLWHGAAWSYAVWGLWHGAALILERIFMHSSRGKRGYVPLRILGVFSYVTLGWLLFKLPEFSHVIRYVKAVMFNMNRDHHYPSLYGAILFSTPVLLYYFRKILKNGQSSGVARSGKADSLFLSIFNEELVYALLLAGIIINSGEPGAFIYFQF